MIAKLGSGKRLIPSERFLYDWFEELDEDKQYEIMIAADGTSRKIVEGITNKEIKEAFDVQSGYVAKVGIDGKQGFEIDLSDYDNIDLIRIRVNDEVPDYIPSPNDEEKTFKESSGLYKFDFVYYSKEERPQAEDKNTKQTSTKLEDNRAFTHRNIVEIYPMYVSDKSTELDCVRDVHNLRDASIQYEVDPAAVIQNWMRNRDVIEFLGLWETLHNSDFKPLEFEGFRNQAGANAFTMSPKKWIDTTQAMGIVSKSG